MTSKTWELVVTSKEASNCDTPSKLHVSLPNPSPAHSLTTSIKFFFSLFLCFSLFLFVNVSGLALLLHCSSSVRERKGELGVKMKEEEPKKKRRRRRRRVEERDNGDVDGNGGGGMRDPVEVLGVDLMVRVLGGLDARSLARSLLVSRRWFSLASSDCLWSPLCEQLWVGKAHLPRWAKVPGISKLTRYSRSIIDSKRVRIMKEDLCDHAWNFHFTEAAPDYWKGLDHYWGGTGRPMHRYFHPDGSQSADPDDKVWGGHECSYTVVTSFGPDGKIRENYVRVNRWPRLAVSRREDWGWEMANVISAYSSIPDADKEEGTGPIF